VIAVCPKRILLDSSVTVGCVLISFRAYDKANDLDFAAKVGANELSGLLGQIKQDSALPPSLGS
jgi:hypothetical protein